LAAAASPARLSTRAVQFSAIWSILRISLISRAARQRALRTFWHPAVLIVL